MRIANSPLRRTRNRTGEWHLWKRLPWKLHSNRRTGPLAKKRTVPLARCFRSWASVGSLSLAMLILLPPLFITLVVLKRTTKYYDEDARLALAG